MVTPFVGVWIETTPPSSTISRRARSHPSWVCGLKHARPYRPTLYAVTPFVGVWIETFSFLTHSFGSTVTPFVGVWIETPQMQRARLEAAVTPFVGVWIETAGSVIVMLAASGHTLRGCVD